MLRHRLGQTAVSLLGVLLLGWGLWSVTPVFAQTIYPPANDQYVNDYANVISSADEAQIRDLLAEFEATDDLFPQLENKSEPTAHAIVS